MVGQQAAVRITHAAEQALSQARGPAQAADRLSRSCFVKCPRNRIKIRYPRVGAAMR